MIHPHTERRLVPTGIGYGVVATRLIPRGTIVWVLDDLDHIFTPSEVARLSPRCRAVLAVHGYVDRAGDTVLCWDDTRFENHSCDASTLAAGLFDFDLAVRDIHPGDEVTYDYAVLSLTVPMACRCGSADCRQVVGPANLSTMADRYDERVRDAFALVETVEQPLWDLVRDQEGVRAVLAGTRRLESCRESIFLPRVH